MRLFICTVLVPMFACVRTSSLRPPGQAIRRAIDSGCSVVAAARAFGIAGRIRSDGQRLVTGVSDGGSDVAVVACATRSGPRRGVRTF